MFLETLWTMLQKSPRHPWFDIKSCMNEDLGSFISFDSNGAIDCEQKQ